MNKSLCRGLAATAAAVLAGGLLSVSPAQASDDITINLVTTNDFHGQIDDNLVQWAGTVEQVLADGPADNSLLISAGDNVGESSPASSAQNDDPTIDVLNLLGLDASAVGNHEFDKSYDDLVDHIMKRANFPILGANVTKADASPALDASTMLTAGGLRIAVIGAVTQDTPNLTPPSGIEGLSFGDPVTAINAEVDRLHALPESDQPDLIVATVHDGAPWGTWNLDQAMQQSSFFTRLVNDTSPDVDAIITGHTHNTYVYDTPVPGDSSRTRPIIETGYHGSNIGQITLTVDPDTREVKAHTARNVARVTTSDDTLIASSPTLAKVAQIRDDAVAFADEQAKEAAATKTEYDAAVAAKDDAYTQAAETKDEYDAAMAAGKDAYATASALKDQYDAAAAAGKDAYARATKIKQAYDAAAAAGKDAYTKATTVKQAYDMAVAAGKEAYASASGVRDKYLAAVAAGKDAYTRATTVKDNYLAAIAARTDAYATATTVRDQYLAAMSIGDPDSTIDLAALTQQYVDAMAAGADANAKAASLKDEYDADMAAGKDAYGNAAGMKGDYDADMAAGKDAYANAAGMKGDYDAAMTAGQQAYAQAAALTPEYQQAVAAANNANAKASLLEQAVNAAVATLNAALATVAELKDKLLSLGGLL